MKKYNSINKYDLFTNEVLKLMNTYGKSWVKCWSSSIASNHHNFFTNNVYSGVNIFWTGLNCFTNNYTCNQWATFNQWKQAGYKLKENSKGKGCPIFYFTIVEKSCQEDETLKDCYPILKSFTVFNGQQVEGFNYKPIEKNKNIFNDKKIDNHIKLTGAKIKHGGAKAFYSPHLDFIQIPNKQDFINTSTNSNKENYYLTLLHELGHWTGHKTRENRDFSSRFGSQSYAFEELIAEITGCFLSCQFGLNSTPSISSIKYINNWKELLKKDNKAIMTAFTKANNAIKYINSFNNKLKQVA